MMMSPEQLADVDRTVMALPTGEKRCNTCDLCQVVDEHYCRCTATWDVPANIGLTTGCPPPESVARYMSRKDVEHWQSRRQRPCPLHVLKSEVRS